MISIQIIQYPKIPTRANDNKMTMPHHKFPNKTRNQQMYQQQQQQVPLHHSILFWMSMEHECLGLEEVPLHHSILLMNDTSSH